MSIAHMRRNAIPQIEENPIQKAMDNYADMERDLADCMEKNRDLVVDNGALVAEVNMLREALERADSDRIRLQAVSSTLTGQLLAINAVIGEAMRTAIKNGIEAEDAAGKSTDLDQAGNEAKGILQRVKPQDGGEEPVAPQTSPAPPQAAIAAIGVVDWVKP